MIHRITRRAVGTALVVALLAGTNGCRFGQKSDADSTGSQQKQQGTSNAAPKVDKASELCIRFRVIRDAMKPTSAERKLSTHKRLLASYKSSQTFYAKFGDLFPEAANTANDLVEIYGRARNDTLTGADEAKMGGLEDKINKVIDNHCPNSGYPAN